MARGNSRRDTAVVRSLARARSVQLGMLPTPPRLDEVEIEVHYEACDELGGDFYDFFNVSPTELGIVLADVSGHGVDAALLMSAAKKTMQIHGRRVPSPAEVLKLACEDLAEDLPKNSFVTAWYGVLDLRTGLLRFASAGHNPFLLWRKGKVKPFGSKGVVLGAAFAKVIRDIVQESTLQLEQGDTLLLYTDGVSEAQNAREELFGDKRLATALAAAAHDRTPDLLARLRHEVDTFRAGHPADDDVTLIGLRYTGKPQEKPVWRPQSFTNLRQRTDTFVGRSDEVKAVRSALAAGRRVVTLIGVAGLGKTRTAVEAARGLLDSFPGGVWFVPVSECRDEATLISAITGALDLGVSGGDAVPALRQALAVRQPTLLILDGVEAVQAETQALLNALSPSLPHTRFVATSQLHCGVAGEVEIPLSPLASPRPGSLDVAEAMDFESVRLFVERAELASPGFELHESNVAEVCGICAILEGVPLAIELAASRLSGTTPARILAQLREPSAKTRAVMDRADQPASIVQPLHEALAWSYARLSAWEQYALLQLCVFSGGFYIDAAEAVVAMRRAPQGAGIMHAIDSLLSKSMLWRESTPYGMRFATFWSLRKFVQPMLAANDAAACRTRHMKYFAKYAKEQLDRLHGPDVLEARERIELAWDNLNMALRTALAGREADSALLILGAMNYSRALAPAQQARLAAEFEAVFPTLTPQQMADFIPLKLRGYREQVDHPDALATIDRAEKLIPQLKSPLQRGGVHHALLNLLTVWYESDAALRHADPAIRELLAAGEPARAAASMIIRGTLLGRKGQTAEAMKAYQEAESVLRKTRSDFDLALLFQHRASTCLDTGRYDQAARDYAEAAPIFGMTGDTSLVGSIFDGQASLQQIRGNLEEALAGYMRARRCYQQSGRIGHLFNVQQRIGNLHLMLGDMEAGLETAHNNMKLAQYLTDPAIMLRARTQLALAEHQAGRPEAVRSLLKGLQPDYDPRLIHHYPLPAALLALCDAEVGDWQAADVHSAVAVKVASEARHMASGWHLFALAVRVHVLRHLGHAAGAGQLETQARELLILKPINQHALSSRIAIALLDAKTKPDTEERIRVTCAICGQRYGGTRARIAAVKSCMNCGLEPFTFNPA